MSKIELKYSGDKEIEFSIEDNEIKKISEKLQEALSEMDYKLQNAGEDIEEYIGAEERIKRYSSFLNKFIEDDKNIESVLAYKLLWDIFYERNNVAMDTIDVSIDAIIDLFKYKNLFSDMIEELRVWDITTINNNMKKYVLSEQGKELELNKWISEVEKALFTNNIESNNKDGLENILESAYNTYILDNSEFIVNIWKDDEMLKGEVLRYIDEGSKIALSQNLNAYACDYNDALDLKDWCKYKWTEYILSNEKINKVKKFFTYDLLNNCRDEVKKEIRNLYEKNECKRDETLKDVIDITLISVPVIERYIAYNIGKNELRKEKEKFLVDNYNDADNDFVRKNIKAAVKMLPQICKYEMTESDIDKIECASYISPFVKAITKHITGDDENTNEKQEKSQYIDTLIQLKDNSLKGYVYSYKVLEGFVNTVILIADGKIKESKDAYYDEELKPLSALKKDYLNEELYRKLGIDLCLSLTYEINKRAKIKRRYFDGEKNKKSRDKLFEICKRLSIYQIIFSQDTVCLVENFFLAYDVICSHEYVEASFDNIVDYLFIMLNQFDLTRYLEMFLWELLDEKQDKVSVKDDKNIEEIHSLFGELYKSDTQEYFKDESFKNDVIGSGIRSENTYNQLYQIIQKKIMKCLIGI